MCEALAERFDRVVLFCRRKAKSFPDVFAYYGVRPCFEVRSAAVPQIPVAGRALYAMSTQARLFRAPPPTLFYGRDSYALALLTRAPGAGAPMVLEAHQPPSNRLERFLQRRIFESRTFERLVVISAALRDEYRRLFGHLLEERILVAPDGADPIDCASQLDSAAGAELSKRNAAFQLGYIGSLAPGKGMELIAELAPRLPSCQFHVVGGSPAEVRAWRRRAPFANLVFHGYVLPGSVHAYLGRFDAMLAPYQNRVLVGRKRVNVAGWMSPLKVFEYMAAGKPMVVSDLPVLREVLRDGANALLASPADLDAWVARIEALREEPKLGARLGRSAREDFLARYTWRERAATILAALGVA